MCVQLTGVFAALDSGSIRSSHLGSLGPFGTLDDNELHELSIADTA